MANRKSVIRRSRNCFGHYSCGNEFHNHSLVHITIWKCIYECGVLLVLFNVTKCVQEVFNWYNSFWYCTYNRMLLPFNCRYNPYLASNLSIWNVYINNVLHLWCAKKSYIKQWFGTVTRCCFYACIQPWIKCSYIQCESFTDLNRWQYVYLLCTPSTVALTLTYSNSCWVFLLNNMYINMFIHNESYQLFTQELASVTFYPR